MVPHERLDGQEGAVRDIRGFKPLTEQAAADYLGVSVGTLRRLRHRRSIGYTIIGRRPRYTVANIEEYLIANEVLPCRKTEPTVPEKSLGITSRSGPPAKCGVELGLTPLPIRRTEHLSALEILRPRSSNSPNGSRKTSVQVAPPQTTPHSPECSPATMRTTEGMPSEGAPKESALG